jgi:hypothetical protein
VRLLLLLATLLAPLVAAADAEEASLHAELGAGVLRVEDAAAAGHTADAGDARLAVRGTWGARDWLALDASLGLVAGLPARYAAVDVPVYGVRSLEHHDLAAQLTAGATVRLGVRWIPTLGAFAGVAHRRLLGVVVGDNVATLDDRGSTELLVGASAGLDYRLDAHRVVGVAVRVTHAFSLDGRGFDAVEIPVSFGWYWYPRW